MQTTIALLCMLVRLLNLSTYASAWLDRVMLAACTYGNLAVAETLVRGGADASLTNKEGKKALDLAMQNGYRELVFLLNIIESEN